MIKLEQLDAELPIRDIFAREIFDCDGNLTVETEVLAGDGIVGRVSVPSGTDAGNDAGMDTGMTQRIQGMTQGRIQGRKKPWRS